MTTEMYAAEERRGQVPRGGWLDEANLIGEGNLVRLTRLPAATAYHANGRRAARKGPADYMGICRATRRLIVFDAAEGRGRWNLVLDEHVLPEGQRDVLLSYGRDGAVAGLLAAGTHPHVRMVFWVPWNALIRAEPALQWTDERVHALGPLGEAIDFGNVPGVGSDEAR